jgi:NAD(P) transhydrogenase subunit alpha
MVKGMPEGAVIVDIAAERGGNCELTRPGEAVKEGGVTILGPLNIPSSVPHHASQMYAKNVSNFLLHLIEDGKIDLEREDEITQDTLVVKGGEVLNPRIRELLNPESTVLEERKV